jgi:hypothetical protein
MSQPIRENPVSQALSGRRALLGPAKFSGQSQLTKGRLYRNRAEFESSTVTVPRL